MSAFLLVDRETALIDSYRQQVDYTSPTVTQGDIPGEDLQHLGGVKLPELPDPAIGGQNASGNQNGYSTGLRSFFNRTQRFLGAVAKPPAITNPVQGEVGTSARQTRLYAGVMNQLVEYTPSQQKYVAQWLGNVPVARVATEPGNGA